MVVTEAIAGLGAIKTAFDMAKALESIHESVARDRAVIDLQKEILAAQQAQFALVERVRDLEKQVTTFENWDAEKQRYQMKDFGGGGRSPMRLKVAQKMESRPTICVAPAISTEKKEYFNRLALTPITSK
jgi:hypothetical protein